jgi:hypothetical protein
MTAADWAILVPSIASLLTAAAAYLRVVAHEKTDHAPEVKP